MGDGTKENPYARDDVLRLIEEHGGTEGLDLSEREFEIGINLDQLDLSGIILTNAQLFRANFNDSILDDANLVGANLEDAMLDNTSLKGAHLTKAKTEKISLEHANLEEAYLCDINLDGAFLWDANLKGTKLDGTKLEGAYLYNAELSPDTRLENARWGNYVLGEEREGLFIRAVSAYQRLKIWHSNAGMYDVSGEFFFREMTTKRKMCWWGEIKEFSLKDSIRPVKPKELLRAVVPENPILWTLLTGYNMLCGYGEKPSRVIVSALVVVFGLAAVYLFGGLNLPYSIYYSAVSFTALGYGSWAYAPPSDWVQGVGAAESFIGVFMIALFLITFVRKMTR